MLSVPDSHGMNEIADKIQAKLDSAKRKFIPNFGKQSTEKQEQISQVKEFKAPLDVVKESNIDATPNISAKN